MSTARPSIRGGESRRELIVVIAVLGLLGAVVLGGGLSANLFSRTDVGGPVRIRSDFRSIENALKLYKLDLGDYPATLRDLWQRPEGAEHWNGPYLEEAPRDPWGNLYRYRRSRLLAGVAEPRTCDALRGPHGCPTPGRRLGAFTHDASPADAPALYTLGADGQPGGEAENADLISSGRVRRVDWATELDYDLHALRRAIRGWEQAHPGYRLSDLNQLPAPGRRRDPWGRPYVYLADSRRTPAVGSIPVISASGLHFTDASAAPNFVVLSLGADRDWGGVGLAGDRGWSSWGGMFAPQLQDSPTKRAGGLAIGLLSGGAVIAIPGGLLLFLLGLRRRRRRRAPEAPAPEVVLAHFGGRCAYCHDDAFGVTAPCPDCGALLHGSCWLEGQSCTTLGCNGRPKASFAVPREPATITADELRQLAAPPSPLSELPRTA